jgi:16S rRNA (guanine527-N7)-methyltransferase
MVATAIEQLRLQSAEWGIALNRAQLSLLTTYADLLAGYKLANIVGSSDRDEIIVDHLLDSLSCFLVKDLWQARSVVDVGAGAGFPGIPLAIVRPGLRVALLEATEKKARFLNHAQDMLGLCNLQVLQERAEEAGRKPDRRETSDVATARALASLSVVVEYCAPLVRPGGVILAMKARLSEEELSKGAAASHELGAELREVRVVEHEDQLPHKERRLVVFEKVGRTPRNFPRRVGVAKKRPLGGSS